MIKKVYLFGCLFLLLTGCKSCKYSLSGINIPADVNNISIAYFDNKSQLVNPSISQKFTEQLKDKFLRETSLAIIPSNGDFQLSGFITDYKIEPVATTTATGSAKNRFSMTVKAKFESPKHKDMNFEENFTKFQEFEATENFQTIESRLAEEVSKQIIQEIFTKIALRW